MLVNCGVGLGVVVFVPSVSLDEVVFISDLVVDFVIDVSVSSTSLKFGVMDFSFVEEELNRFIVDSELIVMTLG